MSYIYAKINKDTLRYIRSTKQISIEYVKRITKFSEEKLSLWENDDSEKLPTINQAKALAKCYHVPFAGFYMNSEDINIKYLPTFVNRRTMIGAERDESAVHLAIFDLLNDRDFYLDTKRILKETVPQFDLKIHSTIISDWSYQIRKYFDIELEDQFRTTSKRKFYLYLRNKVEEKGIFVQGFTGVEPTLLRGLAICDGGIPVIGINDKDRYPAKSFTILHELVHVIKRSSTICNDMLDSNPLDSEEVFCNAIAGDLLVPQNALLDYCNKKKWNEYSVEVVDNIADKFSVSSDVIARRLRDIGMCTDTWYSDMKGLLSERFEKEREENRVAQKMGISNGPKRNMPREAVDRTSTMMCLVLIKGYNAGLFDKADISGHVKIGVKHINNFMSEVMKWYL